MYIFFRRKFFDRKSVSFVTGEIFFQVYLTLAGSQTSSISFIARGKVPFLHNPFANHVLVSVACVASISNRVIARKLERKQKKPSPSPSFIFFALVPAF